MRPLEAQTELPRRHGKALTSETVQAWLVREIARHLKMDFLDIDPDAPISSLPLDSLDAVELSGELEDWLGVALPPTLFWDHPTLASIAAHIATLLADSTGDSPDARRRRVTVELPGDGPLEPTPEEELVLRLCQEPGGAQAQTCTAAVRLHGVLNAAALHDALAQLVERHQALGSSAGWMLPALDFGAVGGGGRLARAEVQRQAHTAIDPERPPLLRARLLRLSDEDHVLVISASHMVFDGWSLSVALRDLAELYTARIRGEAPQLKPLPPAAVVRAFQKNWLDVRREGLTKYWARQLGGASFELGLTDRVGERGDGFGPSAVESFRISDATHEAIHEACHRAGCSQFVFFLTCLDLALYELTGKRDLTIVTASHGRVAPEMRSLIGYFARAVCMRVQIDPASPARALLSHTASVVADAIAHQGLPFAETLAAAAADASGIVAPPVLLLLDADPLRDVHFDGLRVVPFGDSVRMGGTVVSSGITDQALLVAVTTFDDSLWCALEYDVTRLRREDVCALGQTLSCVIKRLACGDDAARG
jgi:acyl carrier protein